MYHMAQGGDVIDCEKINISPEHPVLVIYTHQKITSKNAPKMQKVKKIVYYDE